MADLYPEIPAGYSEPVVNEEYETPRYNIPRYRNIYPLTVTANVTTFEEMLKTRNISLTDDEEQKEKIKDDLTKLQSLGGIIGIRVYTDPQTEELEIHIFADSRLNTKKYFEYYTKRHKPNGFVYDDYDTTAYPYFSIMELNDGTRYYGCLGLVFLINEENTPPAVTGQYSPSLKVYNYDNYGIDGTDEIENVNFTITATIEYSYILTQTDTVYVIGSDLDDYNETTRAAWIEEAECYDTGTLINLTGNDYLFGGMPVKAWATPTNSCGDCDQYFAYNTETGEMLELLDAGMINVYTTFSDGSNFANTAMNELASSLWTTGLFSGNEDNHRMNAIIGVSLFPGIPEYSSTAVGVQVGDELLPVGMSNNAYIFPVTKQYAQIDMGSIDVEQHFGNFLDYEPFSKMQIYMPFIGIRDVDINEFMGGKISLQYIIDYISGNVTVHVHSDLHPARPLYMFNGSCSVPIPITGNRQDAMIRNQIQNTVGVVAGVAGAMGSAASANLPGVVSGLTQAAVAGVNLEMQHPQILRSGSLSGNAGYMGDYGEYSPFIIISRPTEDYTPDYYANVRGFASYQESRLGELSGFTQVQACRVNNMSATQTEKDEILQLLQNGVIL